jgi:hypothetical protein
MRFVVNVHIEVCMPIVSARGTVQTDGVGWRVLLFCDTCCSLRCESTVMTSNGGLATEMSVVT